MKQRQKTKFVNINLSYMNTSLSIQEAALLSLIVSLSKKKGYCFASNENLSKTLGLNERTTYRILKRLEEGNYIKRVTRSIGNFGKERRIYVYKDSKDIGKYDKNQ